LPPPLRAFLRGAVVLSVLVNALTMLTPIINEGDSVLYATLAQHMVASGNWMDLVLDHQDWLDKPHFPFWLGALFFKLLGISATSYILPGFLFHLLGAITPTALRACCTDATPVCWLCCCTWPPTT